MRDLVINSTVQNILLLLIPMAFAYLLKKAHIRSWALLGGAIGGILLGPAVLGNVLPKYWEGLFEGGTHQHELYSHVENQQKADLAAAIKLGASENIIMQMRASQQYELQESKILWDTEKWNEQAPLRYYVICLTLLILISGAMRSKAKEKTSAHQALSVGAWAALVPSALSTSVAYWFWGTTTPTALAFGACMGVGPWVFTRWEQQIANTSEQGGASLMLYCGRVAWLVSIAIAIYATWEIHGIVALFYLLPLLVLPGCWFIPAHNIKLLDTFVDHVAIPSLMATTLVLIHPIQSFSIWPMVVVILFCADARWLGGILGLTLLGGRKNGNAMKLALPLVDASISQLCITALLFITGVLTPTMALALLFGAIFLDQTARTRMKFAYQADLFYSD